MSKRLLHELGHSLSYGRLSLRAKVLWPMLLASTDDQGRGLAESDAIKWYVCPNVPEIVLDEVPVLLQEMADQGMILLYQSDRECQVYQVLHWWDYQELQWARPSRHDPPDGWIDRIRYSDRGDYHQNDGWTTTGGFDAKPRPITTAKPKEEPRRKPASEPADDQLDCQPNLTQPNLTQPNLSTDHAPAPPTGGGGGGPSRTDPALDAVWKAALSDLYAQNEKMYRSWLHDSQLTGDNGSYVVWVRTAYAQEWCTGRLLVPIQRALAPALGRKVDDLPSVEFAVEAAI